jgi:type I restriction enzyme, S subunit
MGCYHETFTGREKPFSYKITGKTWVNNHAHVLRAKKNILDTDFLNYALSYYPFTPMTTGTTGRKKLVKSVLMDAPFALPPLEEQQRIVSDVERRLSVTTAVEEMVRTGLQHSDRLRQAILKQAFKGKLIGQSKEVEEQVEQTVHDEMNRLEDTLKQARLF